MNSIGYIFTNKYLIAPLLTGIFAQFIKFILYWIKYKKPDFSWLVSTGGMPSSHSAAVMCLSTITGIEQGFKSPLFGITLYFSLIIMYDATGLRRAAGEQAKILNKILDEFGEEKTIHEERLKEFLGHTPIEVLMGAILGILAGISATM